LTEKHSGDGPSASRIHKAGYLLLRVDSCGAKRLILYPVKDKIPRESWDTNGTGFTQRFCGAQ
jgi:hypothetical protein